MTVKTILYLMKRTTMKTTKKKMKVQMAIFRDFKDLRANEDYYLINSTTSLTILEVHLPLKPLTDNITFAESPIGYEVPCGVRNNGPLRIVGGSSVVPGEFPWQVSLQLISGWKAHHICGGAVLSAYWIVTAGHCVFGIKASALSIVAGDHNLYLEEGREQRLYVTRVITKQFRLSTFSNDIALLQLNKPLRLDGEKIAPICLPKPGKQFLTDYGIVTGWGRLTEKGTLPHILQMVTLPLIRKSECHDMYRRLGYAEYLHDCQICSGFENGGGDSCQGDSGGPFVCQHKGLYYLCGVVSWGVGCARPHLPGIYTDVSCYSDWIHSVLYNENGILNTAQQED